MGQSQDRTVERGDIIVNDEKSKALSQPRSDAPPPPRGRTSTAAPAAVPTDAGQSAPPASDPRPVRSVGPTIVPMR